MPINLSPDGGWVAYSLRDPSKGEPPAEERYLTFARTGAYVKAIGCDVWITNTWTGESKNLTGGKGSSWSPVWSPDGSRLAFYSDRSGQANLWMWEKSSGTLRQVSNASIRYYLGEEAVRWTSDGKKVLAKILPEGMTLEDISNLTVFTEDQYRARQRRRASTVFVYSSPPDVEQAHSTGLQHSIIQTNKNMNFYLADLAMVDVSTGEVRRIARGIKPAGYWMSPDGSHVAFTNAKGWQGGSPYQSVYDLVVISLLTARATVVACNIQLGFYGANVSWSPDSKLLAYTTTEGECFIVSIGDGEPRKATSMSHPSFASAFRPPLWDPAGRSLYFIAAHTLWSGHFLGADSLWKVSVENGTATELVRIPGRRIIEIVAPREAGRFWSSDGGRSILVITRNDATKQMGFYKVDLSSRRFTRLLEENKDYGWQPAFSTVAATDGLNVYYVAQDAQHSEDIWAADAFFQRLRRLTRINPELERYALGESRIIEWKGLEGERLRGALLLPANYEEGKRYPLIVYVYGIVPLSDSVNRFGLNRLGSVDNMQLLATRGYAVLLPDGTTRVGTPMRDIYNAVIPGVNKVIELGIADPDRLGVMGHSYGGYGTLSLIVQTTRFKAAISFAGPSNLFSWYSAMREDGLAQGIGNLEEGAGRIGGSPWEYRERYIENSPVFYLDSTQTPLLVIQGTLDDANLPFLADEVFVDLRRLGKEVTYVKYEGEGHVFQGYANLVDYYDRMITWFDEHLKRPVTESAPKR